MRWPARLNWHYPAADTADLEKEIDFMVYALYGLSEEEIEIVEGS